MDVEGIRCALEEKYGPWERMTLADRFDLLADEYGDRPFLMTPLRDWTYREVSERSDRVAAGLLAAGVRRRDHVAMIMANHPEFVVVKLAIAKVGAVAVPLNFALKQDEVGYLLRQSDASFLVTMDRFRDQDYLALLDAAAPGWRDGSAEELPLLREAVVFPAGGEAPPGVASLSDLEERGDGVAQREVEGRRRASAYPDEVCDVLYTSGTTSLPKGVTLTHDMLWRSAFATCYGRGYEDGRRIFFPLPLYHVFAYVEGLLAAALVGGAIIPQVVFDPGEALWLLQDKRADEALFVPAIAVALLSQPDLKNYDLSALRSVLTAAAPAPTWVWEKTLSDLGLEEVHTAYGMTEVAAATVATRPGANVETVATRIGALLPGGPSGLPEFGGFNTQYKTVDPITGEDLPPGAEGELACRGNYVTRGYYKKPAETAEVLDKDGWLRTGDLGRIHDDGYLELTGRSKEIYIINGENVIPKEIEEVLARHSAVQQVFVVGVPDEKHGEVGVAFIVPREASPTEEEIVEHARRNLAGFKVPKYVVYVSPEELPMTASGKIQKFRLAERAIAELGLEDVRRRMSAMGRMAEA